MDVLAETAAAWNIPLDAVQLAQFATYLRELQAWNARVNLTAITDAEGIVTRHFLDSLRCALSWGRPPNSLIDVGTGAGFPGLPLKLLRPALKLTLVESVEKKATFLRHLVELLDLRDVTVLTARAETIGRDAQHRERYDLAVARAVAELRVLAEYCLPLCCVGGRFLAPKGAHSDAEVEQASTALAQLGGRVVAIELVALPYIEPRTLVVVDKFAPTPAIYPRAVGVPTKRPL